MAEGASDGTEPTALAAGGEMGERVRSFDWSTTPVGPLEAWPQSLRTIVRTMLSSRYAMWMGWGPELTFFYNDAYARMTLGPKHPWALGRPAREVWSEIWGDIGPRAESVLRTGEATWDEGLLLFLERNGFPEETYHTFSYSPVPDDADGIGGLLCVVTEDTERTIGERRLRTLRETAARTTDAGTSAEEACRIAADILAASPQDLPFVLLYLLDADGRRAHLAAFAGVAAGADHSPAVVDLEAGEAPWALGAVAETGTGVVIDDLQERFGALIAGAWPDPLSQAVALPLAKPGQTRLAGFAVVGVSPRRPLDDAYRGFFDLLAGQIAAAIASARAYEEERRRAQALAELDRAKTAFFSNVSHEFRTPLTLMLGPVEDLLSGDDDQLPPVARERLDMVNRNGVRLLRLVNSLLDFSRIEAGRVRAVYRPTDLAAYTAELASVFRSACERAGLALTIDCSPLSEPAYVDREMWEKVVLNLLSNAFKFTLSGEIAVSVRERAGAAEVRVRDTGIGIAPDEMPRLFERFHRIENAGGRSHEGSGIGLALVQELVKLHGGTVTAESEPGKGTTFVVVLPLGPAHLPGDQIGAGSGRTSAPSGAESFVEEALRWLPEDMGASVDVATLSAGDRSIGTDSIDDGVDRPLVLVADDNADMRGYVVRLLSERYRVEGVEDGEAALASIRIRKPDLVLTDAMMPRLDGFGLLQALRANAETSGLPIILLSARAGEESRVEGMDAGADDYLVKPFSAKELLARVGAHLHVARIRRDAEEAVRRSERDFRAFVTASSDIVYRMSADWSEMRNLEGREFVADTHEPTRAWIRKYIHPDDQALVTAAIDRAVRTKSVFELEHRVLRLDGTLGWTYSRAVPLLDDRGEIAEWFGAASDVTARKNAEQGLQAERDLLSVTLSSIGDAVITTDTSGRVVNMNPVAEGLTGWSLADAVGEPLDDVFRIVNETTRRTVENPAARALREGVIVGLANHTILLGKDGAERPIDDSAAPIRDAQGEVVGCVLVFRDISDRKEVEAALQESERRYRLVGDAANDAIWDWDLRTNHVVWNEGVLKRFGYSAEQVLPTSQWWYDHIHPDDRDRVVGGIHAVIDEGNVDWSEEYRFARASDEYAYVFDRGRVVRDETGAPVRMVGSMLDLTERRRAEEELRRVAAELSEANRRKTEFLATLGHELRNPMAPIRTGLELLRTEEDPALREETREMMERQAKQMVRLIDDLLDVSRITQGKLKLSKCRVAISEAVRSAVEATRPFLDEAGHTLVVDLPEDPVELDADPSRLAQVFSNLLNNAAKYTPDGGHIGIAATREGNDVVVAVSDDGIGIQPQLQHGIFEMFNQIDRPLEKGYKGLGIGLTLVKRLVEMHGGGVAVRSEGEGRGSQFLVRLPASTVEPLEDRAPVVPSASAPSAKRLRALVVDDNKAAADMLGRVVKMLGNDVRTAYDGVQGVEVAEEFRPHIILMDLGMPRMNGYEAARQIRQRSWSDSVVLVALTGWGQDDDRRRTQEAGFDRHLVKPAEPAILQQVFAEIAARL